MCGGEKKNSNITQEMKSESACKRSAAQLISLCTHPSLWPSQRQPSLSQPVCQRQTVFVNDWALPLRQETRMERERKKKKRNHEEEREHVVRRHFTSWGRELPPSSPHRLWLHGHISEGCILQEGERHTASHHSVLWFPIPEQSATSVQRVWMINAEDSEASLRLEIYYKFESCT